MMQEDSLNQISLAGVKAVVTGASSGLGLAMSEALGRAGASVAMAARGEEQLNHQAARLQALGYHVHSLVMDVRSEASIASAVQWVESTWGRIDLLVNNAGIGMRTVNRRFMLEPQPFYEVTAEGFRDVIDTNLTGYFLVAKGFARMMVKQREGKIVNISMNHSTMRRRGFVPYGPSRAGAESLSYIMAEDLQPYGVTVNMLLPGGATETGMIPEELKSQLAGPMLQPEIMAVPIVFLASKASDGITGERITATEFDAWYRARFEQSV